MVLELFLDLDVVPNLPRSLTVYCDNTSAIANLKEPRAHKVVKHIEHKYHLIRGIINQGDIVVDYIASEYNRSDPFTKSLLIKAFCKHVEGIRVRCMNI